MIIGQNMCKATDSSESLFLGRARVLYGLITIMWAFWAPLEVKNLPDNVGKLRDTGLIPGLGRSPGGGHGNPL